MNIVKQKAVLINYFFVGTFFLLSACTPHVQDNVESKDSAYLKADDQWIVLETKNAKHKDAQLEWDFTLERTGKYVIQLVSERPFANNAEIATVTLDNKQHKAKIEKTYTIDAKHQSLDVFEYATWHDFTKTGTHNLTLKTDANIRAVRIIPSFKNVIGSGKYHEQWLTMHQSPEKQAALTWFKDARFGMFIHWGLYSEAAGSWKGTRIKASPNPGPKVAEWLMFKFQISREEYAELAKTFEPNKSFAQNIARLAKDAGMKYVVITSKHHDGFALFDSEVSSFNIVDATPYKADAIKELYDAFLAEGIAFGVYYSHGNDWQDGSDGNYAEVKARNDKNGVFTSYLGKNLWDPSPNTHKEYLQSKAYPQVVELVNLLPDLKLIWFDGDGLITEEQSFKFYELIYNMNPNILVNRRVGYDFGDYLDAGDNVIPSVDDELVKHWETCGTTNNSWGYNNQDIDWKSTKELLYYFVDITSKGGNYLLNVGPDGQGHVPDASAKGLREMGKWVNTNSDAIFGTRRWKIQNEGQAETLLSGTGHREDKGFSRVFTQSDFWFTAKQNKVYAMSLAAAKGIVNIKSLGLHEGKIKSLRLLGSNKTLNWTQTNSALEIDFTGISTNINGYAVEATF